MVRFVLAALAVSLSIVPAAAAKPITATGTLTIAPYQTSGTIIVSTFQGVPAASTVELSVGCEDYFNVYVAPSSGDGSSPWTVIAPTPPGEVCGATLFYYVWRGHREVSSIVLASAQD